MSKPVQIPLCNLVERRLKLSLYATSNSKYFKCAICAQLKLRFSAGVSPRNVNSEDLFQPQNAKLAPEAPKADQPTVGLFQLQLGQNYPIVSRNSSQWDTIWPFGPGPAPVNRAIMALK